jgi:hypothetical protein
MGKTGLQMGESGIRLCVDRQVALGVVRCCNSEARFSRTQVEDRQPGTKLGRDLAVTQSVGSLTLRVRLTKVGRVH